MQIDKKERAKGENMKSMPTTLKVTLSVIVGAVITAGVNFYYLGTSRAGLNWYLLLFIGLGAASFCSMLLIAAPFLQLWSNRQRDRDIFKRNFLFSLIVSIVAWIFRYAVIPSSLDRLEDSIFVAFVLFVGMYGLTFFWSLTDALKRFTYTTLAEIYDGSEGLVQHGRISDGLTNAHIASLQYYNIIPKIIINDSNTYCGFVYLRRASFSNYADWVKQLFEYGKIHSYDTMNIFPPDKAIGRNCKNREAVIRIQDLLREKIPENDNPNEDRAKIKIQVVDIGYPPLSSEDTENELKKWAIGEYKNKGSRLCNWLNSSKDLAKWLDVNTSIPLHWQFKHSLEENQYFLGEYVVLNRLNNKCGYSKPEQKTMVIRYDEDEHLMEWLLGNSNTMFCCIFSHLDQLNKHEINQTSNLTTQSAYLDFFRREDRGLDLFKWQELLRTKLESEAEVIQHK